jgi:engulfment/cell motility protein 1
MVQDLLDSLSTHGNTGIDNLLQRLNAGDQQFLSQLVEERNGVPIILKRVLYDLDTHEDTKIINYLLDALCHMTNMSSGVLKLVESSEDGIKLITILSQKLGIQGSADQPRVKYSATLLTLAQKSPELSSIVGKEINVQRLLELILNRENSPTVQTSTLALFNELVLNAEDRLPLIQLMEKNSLAPTLGKQFSLSNDKCSALQKRQLYYVQCWTLFKYKRMMKTSVDSQDQKAVGMIKELRKIAFERNLEQSHQPGMGTLQRNRFADDYKTLGFDSTVDPTQDFQKSPGLLALFLMHDFATRNADVFNKLVLESSCRGDECPYAMSSIGLVKVLCQVFHIDEDPLDGGSTHGQNKRPFWCPFILIREECLAKIFAICILHLFKTWREMRASMNDLDKVMDVTKEQILTALSGEPGKLEEFKVIFQNLTKLF